MGPPFLQVQEACEGTARPRDRGLEESRVVDLMYTCIRMLFILMDVLYKSKNILTLVTIGYIVGFIVGMYIEYCYGPKWPYWIYISYIGLFGTGLCR